MNWEEWRGGYFFFCRFNQIKDLHSVSHSKVGRYGRILEDSPVAVPSLPYLSIISFTLIGRYEFDVTAEENSTYRVRKLYMLTPKDNKGHGKWSNEWRERIIRRASRLMLRPNIVQWLQPKTRLCSVVRASSHGTFLLNIAWWSNDLTFSQKKKTPPLLSPITLVSIVSLALVVTCRPIGSETGPAFHSDDLIQTSPLIIRFFHDQLPRPHALPSIGG